MATVMLNEVINPRRSIARKYIKRNVSSGVDGYKIWKKKKGRKVEK